MQMDFPEHNTRLTLQGPAGNLEAQLEFPALAHANSPVAVICHPHPPDGGSMNNKVVSTLAKAFTESGYISLRFNFRGVGHSEGGYDHGIGEQADCLAVLDWLQTCQAAGACGAGRVFVRRLGCAEGRRTGCAAVDGIHRATGRLP